MELYRRALLAGTAMAVLSASTRASSIEGSLPWSAHAGDPPQPIKPGPWQFFAPEEGAAVEVLMDRLIPPDNKWPGAKDAGCAVYLDRQLAGPYGRSASLYMRPPFADGAPTQGPQSPLTPVDRYRSGLAALADHVRTAFVGKRIHELPPATLDDLLHAMESGRLDLGGTNGKVLFEHLLKNTQEGYFADPLYGGNRDMAGWRMIGFPGARYDYRDWVGHHNERYPLPPVSIYGRSDWSAEKG